VCEGVREKEDYCTEICFLGAFTKLLKATISFFMSLRPSVCRQGTTRLHLEWFSWNFIFVHFSKICWENSSFFKIWQ